MGHGRYCPDAAVLADPGVAVFTGKGATTTVESGSAAVVCFR